MLAPASEEGEAGRVRYAGLGGPPREEGEAGRLMKGCMGAPPSDEAVDSVRCIRLLELDLDVPNEEGEAGRLPVRNAGVGGPPSANDVDPVSWCAPGALSGGTNEG
jgi:hypothetical protein